MVPRSMPAASTRLRLGLCRTPVMRLPAPPWMRPSFLTRAASSGVLLGTESAWRPSASKEARMNQPPQELQLGQPLALHREYRRIFGVQRGRDAYLIRSGVPTGVSL